MKSKPNKEAVATHDLGTSYVHVICVGRPAIDSQRVSVNNTTAPLRARLTPPATLTQGRIQQNARGKKDEAEDLVQLAI